MTLNIKIREIEVINGDTSNVRKEFEGLFHSSALIKKHENEVALYFQELTPFDMLKRLKSEEFKFWFRKLDKELPGLPYFLNESSNSLLFFLMGNINYEEKDSVIVFKNIEASRFFKEKMLQIRNLCLPHNINPQPGITRLARILSGEKENNNKQIVEKSEKNESSSRNFENNSSNNVNCDGRKKGAIKDFLDKYGSIAFLNSDRTTKITLVINEIPQKISFSKNFLVKDASFPQPFFLTILKTDSGISQIRSLIIANISDIESSIDHCQGAYIQVVTKSDEGEYQMLFEAENPFHIDLSYSLEKDLDKFESENNSSFNVIDNYSTEIIKTVLEPSFESQNKISTEDKVESKNSWETEIINLKRENEELLKKLEKLEKLIEVYEEEINKKRSLKGFFRKFFS